MGTPEDRDTRHEGDAPSVVARPSKRDNILDAAARLIREQGVHAASISEIVKASGSSAGSIYHHFTSKNDVVLAVAEGAVVEPLRRMLAAHAGRTLSPGDLFRAIVSTVLAGDLESALIVQLWAGSSNEPQIKRIMREQVAAVRAEMGRHLEPWLAARGVQDAAAGADGLAAVTLGQAMGLLAQRTLTPELDQAAYTETAATLLDLAAEALARQLAAR